MTIQQFKREAQRRGNYEDNRQAAAQAWARSWGFDFHSNLWAWQSYKLGNMEWKGGPVRLRHGSYTSVDCRIDGELVSEYKFKKALENFKEPALTQEEQAYIDNKEQEFEQYWASLRIKMENQRHRTSRRLAKKHEGELSLCFA